MRGLARAVLSTALLTACQQTGPSWPGQAIDTAVHARTGMPVMATISYWDAPDYARLPTSGIGLINPQDGILDATPAQVDTYRPIVADAAKRGIRLLAYVPTGYGERDPTKDNSGGTKGQSLEQIERQIDAYIAAYGTKNLAGIFFDEADEPCAQATQDYRVLGDYVRARGLSTVAWNPGWEGPDACFVQAAAPGEIVATFESDLHTYLTDPDVASAVSTVRALATKKHVRIWHLIHTAAGDEGLKAALDSLRARQPDYAYVTDLRDWTTGDNTWGKPPSYWPQELACLVDGTCP